MIEKLRITISKEIDNTIESDCVQFGFLKKDSITPNRNAFLNQLISSFYLIYQKQRATNKNQFKLIIKKYLSINDVSINELSEALVSNIHQSDFDGSTNNITISYKPNKITEPIVGWIKESISNISQYFRDMLTNYSLLSQAKRERILFTDIYSTLERSIKENKEVMVILKNEKKERVILSPYSIATSKPEIGNYLLSLRDEELSTIRLNKIENAFELYKNSIPLTEKSKTLLSRALKYGPQYRYSSQDKEIIIKLDPFGFENYRKMYLYRPLPDKQEGDCLFFNCSPDQIFNYFIRFGSTIQVISPKSLNDRFKSFYQKGLNSTNTFKKPN